MAHTRAWIDKRRAALAVQIEDARAAFERHTERATAAELRKERLTKERDWLAKAPVSDPLPEEGDAE